MKLTKDQQKDLLKHDIDHEGQAQSVLVLYPGMFRHNDSHGWLQYNGRFWEHGGARQSVERAVTNTLQQRRALFAAADDLKSAGKCRSWRGTVTNTMGQLAKCSAVFTPMTNFDKSPDKLNVNNGVIDLKTGKIAPHDCDQLYTYCLPVNYNPENKSYGQWEGFLQSVGHSDEIVDYLQLAVGYSLTGHTGEEIMFYLYGPTRSGKGTFTEVLNSLLGELATGVSMETFTSKRYGDTSNFDLAPLKAKRLITASESQRQGMLNPSVIKRVTGGDEIYCSFKRKDHFSYRPQFKIWLTSNFSVNIDVDDDAAWGRLRVIHFKNSFLGKEDKGLKDRLKKADSLEALLTWAVEGAMRWYSLETYGLPLPDEVARETAEHRKTLDSIAQFIDQMCNVDILALDDRGQPLLFTVGKQLYGAYRSWCEEEGYMPFGRKRFTMSLENRGISSMVKWHDGKAQRGYAGIRFEDLSSQNGHYQKVSIEDIPLDL